MKRSINTYVQLLEFIAENELHVTPETVPRILMLYAQRQQNFTREEMIEFGEMLTERKLGDGWIETYLNKRFEKYGND